MPEFLPFLRCGLLYSAVPARLTGIHFWRHCYFKDLGGITVVVVQFFIDFLYITNNWLQNN
jgi:hypothetical protein